MREAWRRLFRRRGDRAPGLATPDPALADPETGWTDRTGDRRGDRASRRGGVLAGLALALAIGLIGAVLLHITIILALPHFTGRDTFTRIRALGESQRFHPLAAPLSSPAPPAATPPTATRPTSSPQATSPQAASPQAASGATAGLSDDDPFLKQAACVFDVTAGPVRLSAEGAVPFWSIGLFDRAANEVYSMNDSTAVDGRLELIAGTSAQIARLRALQSDALAQTVLVELPGAEAYAVLRVFVPQPSLAPGAVAFLEAARCGPLDGP